MYNKTLQTFTFTIGFITAEQTRTISHAVKKIDSNFSTLTAPTGTMINSERVSRTMFQFIAKLGEERELFFKLKLKYAAFTLHPSSGHAMLITYGPV